MNHLEGGWPRDVDPMEASQVTRLALLYCTVLYCAVLHCTILYCTVLYCTDLSVQLYRARQGVLSSQVSQPSGQRRQTYSVE